MPDPTHFAHISPAGRAPMPDLTAAWEPPLLKREDSLNMI
jgi:hypothetical protein